MWSTVAVSVFALAILPIIALIICRTSGKPKKGVSGSLEPRDESREAKGNLSKEKRKTSADEIPQEPRKRAIRSSKQRRISVPGSPDSAQSPASKSARSSVHQELRANNCMKPIARRGGIKQNVRAPNFDLEPPSADESNKDAFMPASDDDEGCNDLSKSKSFSRKLSHRASDSHLASEE